MTPPAQNTDSDIRMRGILEEKARHNEKTIADLCEKFDKHLEADIERWKRFENMMGSIRFAAWFMAIVMPLGVGIISAIGGSIIYDIKQRVARLEAPYLGVKLNGR